MRAPEFWYGHSLSAQALGFALSPLGMIYDLAGRVRFAVTKPYRASVPVICAGNLTAGGSGKTPVAIALAKRLQARGLNPAFLTRGYRGRLKGPFIADSDRHSAADTGDEALLLARKGMTVVSPDRAAGAQLAIANRANVIVMDDGFQNPGLHQDAAFAVVDGATVFGNGYLIPAGPLRETPERGLQRATAVIVMGTQLKPFAFPCPVIHARLEPDRDTAERLRGRRVFAFAGIGRPAKFFEMLRAIGAEVAQTRSFADHHPYTAFELAALFEEAGQINAALVTTEKDWIRLDPDARARILALPVTARFADEDLIDRILAPIL